jgi:hypothetical protein
MPNLLARRHPELADRLAAFRTQVDEMLAVKVAAALLHDPGFRAERCPHALEDLQTVAQVLRVLTRTT